MTIYEANYGQLYLLLLAHDRDDFEAIVYSHGNMQAVSTKTFTTIEDAFMWFHKDILRTDVSCSSCVKKINRQISRAKDKHEKEL